AKREGTVMSALRAPTTHRSQPTYADVPPTSLRGSVAGERPDATQQAAIRSDVARRLATSYGNAQPVVTSIRRGFARSAFGSSRWRTPFVTCAAIFWESTSLETVKRRR